MTEVPTICLEDLTEDQIRAYVIGPRLAAVMSYLSGRHHIGRRGVEEIVETVFDTIKETLERGEKIKISGFGNFVVRDKNARVGRNPQTGQEITISARRVLTFKPSQVLKNALNT